MDLFKVEHLASLRAKFFLLDIPHKLQTCHDQNGFPGCAWNLFPAKLSFGLADKQWLDLGQLQ
jgi:hypothetical protein